MSEFKTFPKPKKKEKAPQRWGVNRKYSKMPRITKEMVDDFRDNKSITSTIFRGENKTKNADLFLKYYRGISIISDELYAELQNRSNNKCEICGEQAEEVHHLVGKRRVAHIENIRHLCIKCHKPPSGIHANSDLYWEEMNRYQNWCKDNGYTEDQTRFLLGRKDNSLAYRS